MSNEQLRIIFEITLEQYHSRDRRMRSNGQRRQMSLLLDQQVSVTIFRLLRATEMNAFKICVVLIRINCIRFLF